ncbi:MAG: SWIM zinc finger family protein [Bacillota bacterium]|jgi:uncharacterized Zn finger protein
MPYRDWEYYTPAKPRKAKDGIKAKSRRGKIGESWWSGRFLSVLERLGMAARMARGRSYARSGQVMDLEVKPGLITATVQGTRAHPYSVKVRVAPLPAPGWAEVFKAMSEKALFMANLLAGEVPQEIEEVFFKVGKPLFPTSSRELDMECSCPDWASPCKHIAAVFYILAESFDQEPFLLFALRGKTKDEVIEELRSIRGGGGIEGESIPDALSQGLSPLEECLGAFWNTGPQVAGFKLGMVPPAVPEALLKGLSPCPVSLGKEELTDVLAPLYRIVAKEASRLALGQEIQGEEDL